MPNPNDYEKSEQPQHFVDWEKEANNKLSTQGVDAAYSGKNAVPTAQADTNKDAAKTLDFGANKIQGYDNCGGPAHRDQGPVGMYLDSANETAADKALKAPAKDVPDNLSREQKEAANKFVAGAILERRMDEAVRDSTLSMLSLDDGIKGQEMMRKSLSSLPDSQKDGAIAVINKELEKEKMNTKVVRVPETNDVYMGHVSEQHGVRRAERLLQGQCPTK